LEKAKGEILQKSEPSTCNAARSETDGRPKKLKAGMDNQENCEPKWTIRMDTLPKVANRNQ
jgi:hypothetical protein